MSEKYVITIGRQYGAGGLVIAEALSKKLGINYYDKNLIEIAAKKSGVGKEFFEKSENTNPVSIISDLPGVLVNILVGGYYGDSLLLNDSLFHIQSNIIKQLARKESCIFVGRCADYILRDRSRCVNAFICADMHDKIKRVSREQNEDAEKLREKIEKTDRQREKYYNFYSGKTWGAAASYHLCVNSSVLGLEDTAELIRSFAVKKLGL